MQPAGFAEGAAGFAGVANERGDRTAARQYATDDLAADAAGGADYCVVIVSPSGKARSAPPPTAPAPSGLLSRGQPATIGIPRDPGITPPDGRDQRAVTSGITDPQDEIIMPCASDP